ncbi:MAG: hypothetical protein ACM34G_17280 [Acidobacteriota bacterium]
MANRRVPPEAKRIIISARVTPAEKRTLLQVGEGNISRGLDRVMIALSSRVLELIAPARGDTAGPPVAGK